MQPCPWPVTELVPHAAPMLLLDRVLAFEEKALVAEVTIGPHSPYLQAEGVPSYLGIEYMAQAIAALAGARGRAQGEKPRIGFLLGTRLLTSQRGWFRPGERLEIHVVSFFEGEQMGSFDGRIEIDGATVVAGRLNVYLPGDR